jgi:hypothetical protein
MEGEYLTQMREPQPARPTRATRIKRFDTNPIPRSHINHVGANSNNRSRKFVTKNLGTAMVRGWVRFGYRSQSSFIELQVGSAQTIVNNRNRYFARTGNHIGNLFHAKIMWTVKNSSKHVPKRRGFCDLAHQTLVSGR